MNTIKLLSNERNMLIRVLERHKKYLENDQTITPLLRKMELEDLGLLIRRVNGFEPKECVTVIRNVDVSIFGLTGEE